MYIAKIRTGAPLPRDFQQIAGIVERVYVVARFSQEVCMPALTTGHVQDARPDGQSQEIDETRDFRASSGGGEKRTVLEKVVRVESGLPPLVSLFQKKTGSR